MSIRASLLRACLNCLRRASCAGLVLCSAGMAGCAATASPAAEDIRDIRGLQSPTSSWLLPALLGGGAAVAVTAYGIARWRRRRTAVPALAPHALALQRLDALRAEMPALGTTAFAVAASDVIRRYIEARFGVTVTRRTTEEFLEDLLTSPDSTLARHRGLLAEFLRRCDYAKFAGATPQLESVDGMYRGARSFVLETMPQESHDSIPAA